MIYGLFFEVFEELFDCIAPLLIYSFRYVYYSFLILTTAYMRKKLYVHIYICIHSAVFFAIFFININIILSNIVFF